jgi:hypothetical protein
MSGSRQDWLDDNTAERLLRGETVDPGRARASEPLVALLAAAAAAGGRPDPAGEEAALAAYRAARDTAVPTAAVLSGPSGSRLDSGSRHRARMNRLRGMPGSAKFAVAAAFATTALVGGVAAAAGTGAILYPFTDTNGDPGPVPTGGPSSAPSPDGATVPHDPRLTGSPSPSGSPSASLPRSPVAPGRVGGGTRERRHFARARTKNGAKVPEFPGFPMHPTYPWFPQDSGKYPHVQGSGPSSQLAYSALEIHVDAVSVPAQTAEKPQQPTLTKPAEPTAPVTPTTRAPQAEESRTRAPQAEESRPNAQPKQAGAARHAKRPKHAKPSAGLSPRLRRGSRTGSHRGL